MDSRVIEGAELLAVGIVAVVVGGQCWVPDWTLIAMILDWTLGQV